MWWLRLLVKLNVYEMKSKTFANLFSGRCLTSMTLFLRMENMQKTTAPLRGSLGLINRRTGHNALLLP